MFKTQNNQPTLANQQALDEIELMSGQEMVELDSQELMNVVGGENSKSTEQPTFNMKVGEGREVTVDNVPTPSVVIDFTSENPLKIIPDTTDN